MTTGDSIEEIREEHRRAEACDKSRPDREKIARILMQQDNMNDDWFFDCRGTIPEAAETCQEYLIKADQILAL